MNRKALFPTIILLSVVAGGYLTYIVEGIKYSSIFGRSVAIILIPFIAAALVTGAYRLLKKKKMSSSSFDKTFVIFWVLGVTSEFATYYLL